MNNISEIRERIGVSQAALAAEAGWKQSRIANYESGIRTPKLADCRALVAAFQRLGVDCSLDDLFPPQCISSRKNNSKLQQ